MTADPGHGTGRAPAAYDLVMVTHDHAATLPACLRAVAALRPRPAAVVVLDNASADTSATVVESFSDELPLGLVRSRTNLGFAAGVNRCLERGRSPWVLLLNPDCAPRPDFVARLLEEVAVRSSGHEIGSVTGKLLRAGDTGLEATATVDAAGMVVTPAGRHLDRGSGKPDDGSFDSPAWVFGPREPYERVGDVDDVVFPTGAVLDRETGELRIYYGAADDLVALATANLTELLDYLKSCPDET